MKSISKIYYLYVKKYIPRSFFRLVNPFLAKMDLYRWKKMNPELEDERMKGELIYEPFFGFHDKKSKVVNQDYFDFIFKQNIYPSKENVAYLEHKKIETSLKAIAFYLPQYHPIEENDKTWGKGFTEWTNVSKAVPQFIGHYQPRLPGELGFYDLRNIDIQRRQVELARNYGIYGFCYHYYWFDGKKILDKPLENILSNPDIDFPFCINWANENWTKRWDGLDNEIILKQNHSPKDDIDFIKEVSRLFQDKRYIRIENKPVLMVYKPTLLPNAKQTAERWRVWCRENGVGEIYLIVAHTFGYIDDPKTIGFDAAVDFPPHNMNISSIIDKIKIINPAYSGGVSDYRSILRLSNQFETPGFTKFRCVCTGWDNDARKPGRGFTFINATPQNYQKWFENVCYHAEKNFSENEKFVFINAWNEWAEGTYLEPDRKYGYAFLEATYNVLKKFDDKILETVTQSQFKFQKKHDSAVILHLFYMDLWSEIKESLKNLENNFDLFISLTGDISANILDEIIKDYPNVKIYLQENKGRDILPFLEVMKDIKDLKYEFICKIHSKKSKQRRDGEIWRQKLINSLLGSEERVGEVKSLFNSDKKIGIILSKDSLGKYEDFIGYNGDHMKNLFKKMNLKYGRDFHFPAGSMFWFRPEALNGLMRLDLTSSDFSMEMGQLDGTMAHAIERMFCVVAEKNGYKIKTI